MNKVKANSVTIIQQARDAARKHFSESSFKFYWDKDELWCCFKEGVNVLAASVFVSMLSLCVKGLTTKIKIVDADSDFWK